MTPTRKWCLSVTPQPPSMNCPLTGTNPAPRSTLPKPREFYVLRWLALAVPLGALPLHRCKQSPFFRPRTHIAVENHPSMMATRASRFATDLIGWRLQPPPCGWLLCNRGTRGTIMFRESV
jgi:hypothetical protein